MINERPQQSSSDW